MKIPLRNTVDAITVRGLHGMGSRGRTGLKLLLCLAAMAVVCGCFVASVLSRPVRTPILTLTGVYGPEWDLNAWIAEDLDTIATLRQGTFSVEELPSIDQMASGFWDRTDEAIRAALRDCSEDRPLTVYVNLHGAVDDQGRACWIPPNGLVADASTWFPITDFLDHVAQLQPQDKPCPIVLLLECGRLRAHWPAGISDNDFDGQLRGTLATHNQHFPHSSVTILSSTARGQRSLASRLGDGDIFTRFVTQGLSGIADGYGASHKADGYVDTDELHRYVLQNVGGWAVQHRGTSQTPTLHRTGSSRPIKIARASHRTWREAKKTPPPSREEIDRLRSALEATVALSELHPISVNAHGWSQVLRTMHSIGQSVYGGRAVRDSSDRWYSRLERQSQSLRKEIAMQASESSHWADVEMNREAHTIWSTLAKQPTRATAEAMVRDFDQGKLMPVPLLQALLNDRDSNTNQTSKLKLANDNQGGSEQAFWRDADIVKRLATTQAAWLAITLALPDELFPAADQIAAPVHESRRHLADTILASGLSMDPSIRLAMGEFERRVETAKGELSALVLAWEIRDQAFLSFPYLVQVTEEISSQQEAHGNGKEESTGIDEVMQLDTLLNQFTDQSQPWTDALSDQISVATNRSRAFLEHLSGSQLTTRMAVTDSTSTESSNSIAEMADVLARANHGRLIASDPFQKIRLEEQLRQMDLELSRKPLQPLVASGDHADKRVVHVTSDFLPVLLGLDPEGTSAGDVRRRLRSLTSAYRQQATERHESRRAVSIIVDEQFTEVIDANQKAARQARLASRVHEVLDDFWYAPQSDNSAYFEHVSQNLLNVADSVSVETPSWKTTRRSVTEKLEARRLASVNGLVIRAVSTPSFIEQQSQSVSVSLDPIAGAGELPTGTGKLSIHPTDSDASLLALPVAILEPEDATSLSSKTNPLTLTTRRTRDSVAEVTFRGNRYRSSVMSSGTAFGVSSRNTSERSGAEMTIRDAMDAGQAVTFVLDCSASMDDPMTSEVGRFFPSGKRANKLDAARSALFEMMRRLQPIATEVGLVLYGHRMAISADERFIENDGLLLQKRYHKRFPFSPTIQPFEDVEVALSTGRFDTVELELARQHLDAVVPWGQTPLYLAISEAISDISRTGQGVAKDIVVISDGRNYQFNPTPETIFTIDQLVAQATEQNVRVHVIGFGLPTEQAALATTEFQALANGTGGESITDVKDAAELLKRLEQLSTSESFQLQMPDGSQLSGKFGQVIQLPEVHEINTPVLVTVGGITDTVHISPGDRLELLANQMQHFLRSPPYLRGSPQFCAFATAEDQEVSVRVGLETPKRVNNDCRFRLSMQRGDQQVSERPIFMWVEVSPLSGHSDGEPVSDPPVAYRTCQFDWLPEMPCPVAEFTCIDWPVEADGYGVQIWCSATTPDLPLLDTVSTAGETKDLPGFEGVTYRLHRTADQIQIGLEYTATDSIDLDQLLMVRVKGNCLASTDHWYDDGGKRSFHVFRVDEGVSDIQLELESIADMKKRSVHTVKPLQGAFLPTMATLPTTTSQAFR